MKVELQGANGKYRAIKMLRIEKPPIFNHSNLHIIERELQAMIAIRDLPSDTRKHLPVLYAYGRVSSGAETISPSLLILRGHLRPTTMPSS